MPPEERSLQILIAEDDLYLGEALVSFLREQGHQVDLARDGGEALLLLERCSYSLILTDLVMPVADGLEILRAARQRDPATLVVIMTGHASLASALQATREGAYDYLRKPFNLQEIQVAVDNAAGLLHLQEENHRLLQQLDELNARLAELQQVSAYPASPPFPAPPPKKPPSWEQFLWGHPLPWELEAANQADLSRLQGLYKENLLTEREFQILKERLLI